jgi:dTDP-4-amino-4,6-dideoxygalactose transaminase
VQIATMQSIVLDKIATRTLAVLGGSPLFDLPLHVGRPNIGNRAAFLRRVGEMLDRRWLTNDGPLVREFERRIAEYVDVRHCVATCNATAAIEIAARALHFTGEVIVPAYTFVATAHALKWQELTPVFADMVPATHNIDPVSIERLLTPRTGAIVGVHVWGRPCDTDAIEAIARRRGIPVMYDAAHAFGCSRQQRMIGGFGSCEVFSFHATKFLNTMEGGAIVTNDDELASKLRLMRNFGISGFDRVTHLGINGKMPEVCAAMGLTLLDGIDEIIARNRSNYETYRRELAGLPGISVIDYASSERNNYQYIVVEVDPTAALIDRDAMVSVLEAENVLARKYFWPGVHRMEPYLSSQPDAPLQLPQTERLAPRVVVLPNGQTIDEATVSSISGVVRQAIAEAPRVRRALGCD